MAIKQSKIFTITGANGGCGKTTTTINLAGEFSKKGLKTLIIDLDLCGGSISYLLNLKEKSDLFKMNENLNANTFTEISDYITSYNDLIDIISATKDPRYASKVSSKYLKGIIGKCSNIYDVILIDTSKEFNGLNTTAFDLSDQIVYLLENSSASLKNMRTLVTIFKEMGFKNYKIVLNQSILTNKVYFNTTEIKSIILKNIDYIIPTSFNIKDIDKYILDGKILTLDKGIMKKYKKDILKFDMIASNLLKCKRDGE